VTSKSIETDAPALSCDVCGRTLLVGEHGDVFLHEGSRRLVCDLCTARAVHEGWIREGLDDAVGDVIGDLNSRRGRPLGMEPVAGLTEVKAEVPMAEMLTYAPDLRSLTAGQGDYTMELARYEEVPAHLAQKVVAAAEADKEAAHA